MAHEFCWIEMSTEKPEEVREFYSALFDWTYEEAAMEHGGVYAMFQPTAGGPGGGIMAKPQLDMPNAWMPYVAVDDLGVAVAKVAELGGSVCAGPMPIKGHGSFAVIADPAGGVIGLWCHEPCSG